MRNVLFVSACVLLAIGSWLIYSPLLPVEQPRSKEQAEDKLVETQIQQPQIRSFSEDQSIAQSRHNASAVYDILCEQSELDVWVIEHFDIGLLTAQQRACLKHLLYTDSVQALDTLTAAKLMSLALLNDLGDKAIKALLDELSDSQLLYLLHTFSRDGEAETFFAKNRLDSRTFVDNTAQKIAEITPTKLLLIIDISQDHTLNQTMLEALMSKESPLALHELWPTIVDSYLGVSKEQLLESVIAQYLHTDPVDTLYYLHDHYLFNEAEQYSRKFNFPDAITTLYAWQSGQIAQLSAEQYDKDSALVINYLGRVLSEDVESFANQLNDIATQPVSEKVVASVIQSTDFFRLNTDQLTRMLAQLPSPLSKALASAYALQFQALAAEEQQHKTRPLRGYLQNQREKSN